MYAGLHAWERAHRNRMEVTARLEEWVRLDGPNSSRSNDIPSRNIDQFTNMDVHGCRASAGCAWSTRCTCPATRSMESGAGECWAKMMLGPFTPSLATVKQP